LLAEVLDDRLIYLHTHAQIADGELSGVQARQFDLSDATMLKEMLAAVRSGNFARIDEARQPMGPGAAKQLVAAYQDMASIGERVQVQFLLFSSGQLELARPVFADVLTQVASMLRDGQSASGVDFRVDLAMAMSGLEGDTDRFDLYYRDDAARDTALARHLR
jgi:hypothetical protein